MNFNMIYVIITAVLFATLEPVSKLIAADISPLALTAVRFLIGGIIFLPISIGEIKKNGIKLNVTDHLKMAGLGVLNVCVSMVVLQYAVKLSSSPALIAIIFSSNSIMTIYLSAFMLKERITAKKIMALILCVAGILVCSWKSLSVEGEAVSVLLAIVAAVAFSLYTVLNKKMLKRVSGNVLMGGAFLYGSIILFIFNLIIGGEFITTDSFSLKSMLIVLYAGVAITGIGYWSYFKALSKGSATMASLAFFVKPVLSPFVAAAINGVPLTAEIFIALILVLSGTYMVSYSGKK